MAKVAEVFQPRQPRAALEGVQYPLKIVEISWIGAIVAPAVHRLVDRLE